MSRQNFSVARVETRTREFIGKYERHNERKKEHYGNMNVHLSRTPMNVLSNPAAIWSTANPLIGWPQTGRYPSEV